MRTHAFAQEHSEQRQRHQEFHRRLGHGERVGTQIIQSSLPFQRFSHRLQASAGFASERQAQLTGRI